MFSEESPLLLDFFKLEFEWIKRACNQVQKEIRNTSFSEFQKIQVDADYFYLFHRILIELISDGKHCFLLINACPIAQLDFRNERGMAEYFDFPAMTKEEWEIWDLLGVSKTYFEIVSRDGDVHLIHIKKEERSLNALCMRKSVNLHTGASSCSIDVEGCTLPSEPTLANLMNWVEVRDGRSDPLVLEEK